MECEGDWMEEKGRRMRQEDGRMNKCTLIEHLQLGTVISQILI